MSGALLFQAAMQLYKLRDFACTRICSGITHTSRKSAQRCPNQIINPVQIITQHIIEKVQFIKEVPVTMTPTLPQTVTVHAKPDTCDFQIDHLYLTPLLLTLLLFATSSWLFLRRFEHSKQAAITSVEHIKTDDSDTQKANHNLFITGEKGTQTDNFPANDYEDVKPPPNELHIPEGFHDSVNDLKRALEQAQSELNGTKSIIEGIKSDSAKTECKLNDVKAEKAKIALELNQTKDDKQDIKLKLNGANAEKEAMKTKLNQIKAQMTDTESRLNDIVAHKEAIKVEKNGIQHNLHLAESKIRAQRLEIESQKSEIKMLDDEKAVIKTGLDQEKAKTADSNKKYEDLLEEKAESDKKIEKLNSRNDVRAARLVELEHRAFKAEAKNKSLMEQSTSQKKQLEELRANSEKSMHQLKENEDLQTSNPELKLNSGDKKKMPLREKYDPFAKRREAAVKRVAVTNASNPGSKHPLPAETPKPLNQVEGLQKDKETQARIIETLQKSHQEANEAHQSVYAKLMEEKEELTQKNAELQERVQNLRKLVGDSRTKYLPLVLRLEKPKLTIASGETDIDNLKPEDKALLTTAATTKDLREYAELGNRTIDSLILDDGKQANNSSRRSQFRRKQTRRAMEEANAFVKHVNFDRSRCFSVSAGISHGELAKNLYMEEGGFAQRKDRVVKQAAINAKIDLIANTVDQAVDQLISKDTSTSPTSSNDLFSTLPQPEQDDFTLNLLEKCNITMPHIALDPFIPSKYPVQPKENIESRIAMWTKPRFLSLNTTKTYQNTQIEDAIRHACKYMYKLQNSERAEAESEICPNRVVSRRIQNVVTSFLGGIKRELEADRKEKCTDICMKFNHPKDSTTSS